MNIQHTAETELNLYAACAHQFLLCLRATSLLCESIILHGNILEVEPLRYSHVKKDPLTCQMEYGTPGQADLNQLEIACAWLMFIMVRILLV